MEDVNQADTFAVSESSKNLLEKFDTHVKNTRQSLAVAKKSMNDFHAIMNHGIYEKENLSTKSADFQSTRDGSVKKANGAVLKSGLMSRKYENTKVCDKEKSQHLPVLSTVVNERVSGQIPVITKQMSCYSDANFNASDPALDQESNPDDVNQVLPEETDQSQINQAGVGNQASVGSTSDLDHEVETNTESIGVDPPLINPDMNPVLLEETDLSQMNPVGLGITSDLESKEETNRESVDINPRIINSDYLPPPSIMIISATPFEMEEAELLQNSSSPVQKQVSFDESAIETVLFIAEKGESRRSSLDENILDLTEKRKQEENTRKLSLRRSQSTDLNSRLQTVDAAFLLMDNLRKALVTEDITLDPKDDLTVVHPEETKDIGTATLEPESAKVESIRLSTSKESETSEKDPKKEEQEHSVLSESDRLARLNMSAMTVESLAQSSFSTLRSASRTRSLSKVLKSIDTVVYKDGMPMMWKTMEYSDQEILVPVPPNSLLSDVDQVTQKIVSSKDKAKTLQPPRESCDSIVKRKLGLRAYNILMGIKKDPGSKGKIRGADWSRQLQMERFASLPHFLYQDQWKTNKLVKANLGPGSYKMKDFIQLGNEKPRSGRGICDNLGSRFDKIVQSCTPGPGTYGISGIPQKALEDKARRSYSTKGMLDAGDRKRNLPSVGSLLAPGTYNYKSFTKELLNKVTGLKGPYKLFTAERDDPIVAGYQAAPKQTPVGPCHYNIKSFVDELCNPKCHSRGRFGKLAQYPEVPTERILLFSHTHHPYIKDTPGPGAYTTKEFPKYKTVNTPGFLSSSKRDDKLAQKFFTRSSSLVGPGRYSVEKYDDKRHVNGHTSVFRSKTGKPSLQMSKFLQARLQTKQMCDEVKWCQSRRTKRSITDM